MLAGAGAYAVFSNPACRANPRLRQVLIGVTLGVAVALISANALILEGTQIPLDAKVGPLIFAGYLGGPVGGLIAAGFGALVRIGIGGPNTALGVGVYLAFGILGAVVARLYPQGRQPQVPKRAIACMFLGFFLVQYLPAPLAQRPLGEVPQEVVIRNMLALAFAGIMSIVVMAVILRYAKQFADDVLRVEKLGQRLKLVAQSAQFGVFERSQGSDMIEFDEGMMTIYGLDRPPGPVSYDEWIATLHPEDQAVMAARARQLWEEGRSGDQIDFRIYRPDGKIRNIREHLAVENGPDGKVARIVGIQEDLTDFHENQLGRSIAEDRLERIIASLPGAIISMDVHDPRNPKRTYLSPQIEAIWGFTQQEAYDDTNLLISAHDPNDVDLFYEKLRQAARTLEGFKHRFKIVTRSGETKWLESHTGVTRISENEVYTDGFILDVTKEVETQKQLEAQREIAQIALLAQKRESIGQLTGGVAHDFNNLLAVIMGNLEMLRDDLSDDKQLQMIDASISATKSGADLTRNMLAFGREAMLKNEVIDLNKLVDDTQSWTGRTLPANIIVETSLMAGLWKIEADPSSTESALLNLTLNARDAMPDGGTLTLKTTNVRIEQDRKESWQQELDPGKYVILAVCDTGHGIPKDVLPKVFDPFFSTKERGAGTGLGLSMIHGFMRQSRGAVQVYSEPGVGTTFKLYFKALEGDTKTMQPETPVVENSSPNGQRILVVEDEAEVLSVVVATLEKAGYNVASATTGDDAHSIFEADPSFDLLLTDMMMPGNLQGATLSNALRNALRAKMPDLRVVFMSGYAGDQTDHGSCLHPKDIFLTKPVMRADLLAAIRKSLNG